MPPRLPTGSLCKRSSNTIRPRHFSYVARMQAPNDPHKAILESLSPAKSQPPSNAASIESRGSGSLPGDSSNRFLSGYPSSGGKLSALTETQNTTTPNLPPPGPDSGKSPRAQRRAAATSGAPQLDIRQARLLEQQLARSLRYGDAYAPHDLTPAEQMKAKNAKSSRSQAFRQPNTRKKGGPDDLDILNINPITHYKNFSMMSEFVSTMGRIRHGRDTGFRAVNQRRMAKAVRRAVGIGIMPSVHRHPELMPERVKQRVQMTMQAPLSGWRI